jgi:hypothetical protein
LIVNAYNITTCAQCEVGLRMASAGNLLVDPLQRIEK